MNEYVAFARARLDELEEYVKDVGPYGQTKTEELLGNLVLADIAAKRKILDAYEEVGFDPRYYDTHDAASGRGDALQECVRLICEPFASHPEYPGERHG